MANTLFSSAAALLALTCLTAPALAEEHSGEHARHHAEGQQSEKHQHGNREQAQGGGNAQHEQGQQGKHESEEKEDGDKDD